MKNTGELVVSVTVDTTEIERQIVKVKSDTVELIEVVREIADCQGISFVDAVAISIKTLRCEAKRKKLFSADAGPDSGVGV